MRTIDPENSPLTQMPPGPARRRQGPPPTSIVAVTSFVSGSMRETVPLSEFATHTEPAPKLIPVGPSRR